MMKSKQEERLASWAGRLQLISQEYEKKVTLYQTQARGCVKKNDREGAKRFLRESMKAKKRKAIIDGYLGAIDRLREIADQKQFIQQFTSLTKDMKALYGGINDIDKINDQLEENMNELVESKQALEESQSLLGMVEDMDTDEEELAKELKSLILEESGMAPEAKREEHRVTPQPREPLELESIPRRDGLSLLREQLTVTTVSAE
jgi:division protein CdvB (Snf7/Vps24/ESCRT-III family)